MDTCTDAWTERLGDDGYFVVRGLLTTEQTEAIRADLLDKARQVAESGAATGDYGSDKIIEQSAQADPESVPLEERFRKLNQLDLLPALWDHWYAGPPVLDLLRQFLGDDVLRKYASAFLKPARVGGPTPWHQDIGLWRDRNADAVNGWVAIDAATVSNGCLEVLPGSHRGPVVEHVTYDDSLHAELPRERVDGIDSVPVELEPGDTVFWHSHLWHGSAANRSATGRIGVGAVWVNPAQIGQLTGVKRLRWALRPGVRLSHPAPEMVVMTEAA
jgi:phytanoyl-CoA hydroxylase